MEYIYDIVLNFHKVYYNFFEWNNNDKLTHIKKIPLIRVENVVYNRIKDNNITVDKDFVELIKNKTICYNKDNLTMCLICNGKETLGIKLNNDGSITSKSSLQLDEEDEVNEEAYNIPIMEINIIKEVKNNKRIFSRIFLDKQDKVKKTLLSLDEDKDKYILKYLYYECYLKDTSINIKTKLLNDIDNDMVINKLYLTLVNLHKIKNTIY